ncbi:MAG: 6-bladed beta-propeller [Betaproteobacteria bacterium]
MHRCDQCFSGTAPRNSPHLQDFGAGKFIKTWGKKGSGPGEFDMPHGLAIDSSGRLFVADRGNSRIQIFDLDGN